MCMEDPDGNSGGSSGGFVSGAAIGDEPTESDYLGFDKYVNSLQTFLTHSDTEPPLTVSIEGDWGSGKSSFMLQLKKELENQGKTTVWFNPWRHDKEDDLWAAFVLEFLDQLRDKKSFRKQMLSGLRLNYNRLSFRRRPKETVRNISIFVNLVLATVLVPIIMYLFGTKTVIPLLSSVIGSQFGAKALTGAGGIGVTLTLLATVWSRGLKFVVQPVELNVEKYMDRPDYGNRISFISRFHEDFQRILDSYAGGDKVFVFIDDLDRCEVPKSAELIQSINLMISQDPRLVFVLGIDRKKLAAGVASKYEEVLPYLSRNNTSYDEIENMDGDTEIGLSFGYEYINKFIQVPFKLPQPKPTEIDNLIENIVGENNPNQSIRQVEDNLDIDVPSTVSAKNKESWVRSHQMGEEALEYLNDHPNDFQETILLVSESLNYNPRKIKRFVNLFRLRVILANNDGLFQFNEDGDLTNNGLSLQQLGKFVAISLQWPRFVSDLSNNPKLIDELENSMKNDGKELSHHGKIWIRDSNLIDLIQKGIDRENGSKYRLSEIQIDALLHVSPRTDISTQKKNNSKRESSEYVDRNVEKDNIDIPDAVGTVEFYNDTGGYGFITTDDTEDDVFFHLVDTDIEEDKMEEGIVVRFDVVQTDKGPRATNMHIN